MEPPFVAGGVATVGHMLEVQRATERYRGGDPADGIDTWHAFSFAGFYDPKNIRFGPLTACNEERLAPGAGFAEHPHRDLEIVTWVLEGELTHQDSTGRRTVIRPGDLQRLTAGDGARHREHNEATVPLRFLQMWLVPDHPGGDPEYEVVRGVTDATGYALPRTDAVLHVRRLAAGAATVLPVAPLVYLQMARGGVRLVAGGATGPAVRLAAGDAARITAPAVGPTVAAGPRGAELLVWELGEPPAGR